MSNLTEFSEILDGAETDPRPGWTRRVDQIIDRELAHVPSDIADELSCSRKRDLARELRLILEEGRIRDANTLLAKFESEIRQMVIYERQHGRLRPVTAATEIERCKNMLHAHRWDGGAEYDALREMIKPGERIKSIDFWRIVLETRELSRAEVRLFGKPSTWSNRNGSWESQFISNAEVKDAEESDARRANPYQPGSDSRNLDLPGGIRQ